MTREDELERWLFDVTMTGLNLVRRTGDPMCRKAHREMCMGAKGFLDSLAAARRHSEAVSNGADPRPEPPVIDDPTEPPETEPDAWKGRAPMADP